MDKVLNVVFGMHYGGTESFILNTERNIQNGKLRFDYLYLKDENSPRDKELLASGSKIHKIRNHIIFTKLNLFYSIYRVVKNNNYNIVHSHLNELNGLIMLTVFFAGARKRISHLHFPHYYEGKNLLKKYYYKLQSILIYRFSTDIFYCSEPTFESYKLPKKGIDKSHLIKNTISLDKFFQAPYRKSKYSEEFSIPAEHKIITNITRFDHNKNQKFIVEVFLEMLQMNSELILLLGGEGAEKNNICNIVRKYSLTDKVRFIGVRNDVEQILKISDLYIFPSIEEGFGIVALEAQACRLHTVCSSNVPKSTDVGLGLASYLDLNLGSKYWAKYMIDLLNCDNPNLSEQDILNSFNTCGYNEIEQAKIVEKIYCNEN
ncbi:glycosyltransferase [uncultured Chryseobacterium sp.]|uniref:glycosyltransferase n=1 Tax=uncultured Chryseobacterium sp. TaxID=259322 RepID=UPI0025FDAF68|nr:glycosyltransferase [uncultured Chryseobacterium sp.]